MAILFTIPLRCLGKKDIIILYGHKLNGNLLALHDYIIEMRPEFSVYYLTMDPGYYEQLKQEKNNVLYAGSITDMAKVAKAKVVISDHGLFGLRLHQLLTSMKFVDVWHGIPYKGFDSQSFKNLHNHDQVWVSSEAMKDIYTNKFGFKKERVKVTGYARVDRLVTGDYKRKDILSKYGLKDRKNILIAPTWAQDDRGRSIVPFGLTVQEFFESLEKIGEDTDSTIIFRAHLNTGDLIDTKKYKNIQVMPYAYYPVAEEFLYISDLLVTDWSSVAFDYLVLQRPTLFLDVRAPFSKGLTLGSEHRYGDIVVSMEGLRSSIELYIERPDKFLKQFKSNMKKTTRIAYGDTLDGLARERCLENLTKLIK